MSKKEKNLDRLDDHYSFNRKRLSCVVFVLLFLSHCFRGRTRKMVVREIYRYCRMSACNRTHDIAPLSRRPPPIQLSLRVLRHNVTVTRDDKTPKRGEVLRERWQTKVCFPQTKGCGQLWRLPHSGFGRGEEHTGRSKRNDSISFRHRPRRVLLFFHKIRFRVNRADYIGNVGNTNKSHRKNVRLTQGQSEVLRGPRQKNFLFCHNFFGF